MKLILNFKNIFFIYFLLHPIYVFAINLDELVTNNFITSVANDSECVKNIEFSLKELKASRNLYESNPIYYYILGRIYQYTPTCYRKYDETISNLSRQEYIENQFRINVVKNMNENWGRMFAVNETASTNKLTLDVLDKISHALMSPELFEKKYKLELELMEGTEIIGAGGEHPIDNQTYTVINYGRMANSYNDAGDRLNALRILEEMALLDISGGRYIPKESANKLKNKFEKQWKEIDQKIETEKALVEKKSRSQAR